jgi:hypothetical protein
LEAKKETFYFLPKGRNVFSLPPYPHRNDRDFFLCGEDDELVTGAVTDASACEVFDRAYMLVS